MDMEEGTSGVNIAFTLCDHDQARYLTSGKMKWCKRTIGLNLSARERPKLRVEKVANLDRLKFRPEQMDKGCKKPIFVRYYIGYAADRLPAIS